MDEPLSACHKMELVDLYVLATFLPCLVFSVFFFLRKENKIAGADRQSTFLFHNQTIRRRTAKPKQQTMEQKGFVVALR